MANRRAPGKLLPVGGPRRETPWDEWQAEQAPKHADTAHGCRREGSRAEWDTMLAENREGRQRRREKPPIEGRRSPRTRHLQRPRPHWRRTRERRRGRPQADGLCRHEERNAYRKKEESAPLSTNPNGPTPTRLEADLDRPSAQRPIADQYRKNSPALACRSFRCRNRNIERVLARTSTREEWRRINAGEDAAQERHCRMQCRERIYPESRQHPPARKKLGPPPGGTSNSSTSSSAPPEQQHRRRRPESPRPPRSLRPPVKESQIRNPGPKSGAFVLVGYAVTVDRHRPGGASRHPETHPSIGDVGKTHGHGEAIPNFSSSAGMRSGTAEDVGSGTVRERKTPRRRSGIRNWRRTYGPSAVSSGPTRDRRSLDAQSVASVVRSEIRKGDRPPNLNSTSWSGAKVSRAAIRA